MHHGTCVTHVPWCTSGSLIRGGGEDVPSIPVKCATSTFTYLVRGPFRHPQDIFILFFYLFSKTTGQIYLPYSQIICPQSLTKSVYQPCRESKVWSVSPSVPGCDRWLNQISSLSVTSFKRHWFSVLYSKLHVISPLTKQGRQCEWNVWITDSERGLI